MESNRNIDLLVAKTLFSFVDDPDEWILKDETWFWVHPNDGVLIGKSWTSEYHNGYYSHQWEKFCPSTNLEHTKFVLDYYNKINEKVLITNLSVYSFDWFVKIGEKNGFQAETISLAVCKAVASKVDD